MFKLITVTILGIVGLIYAVPSNQSNYFTIAEEKLKIYNPPKKDFVVIVDFRKNTFSKRLYLLDMTKRKVILNCQVTHAKASGLLYAKSYSNTPGTEKSSYGAFLSKYSRPGRYGYSMVISGLDKGINDNVEKRVMIFHPTRVPWSKGCFATSKENNKIIIDHIKNGRLIYVIK